MTRDCKLLGMTMGLKLLGMTMGLKLFGMTRGRKLLGTSLFPLSFRTSYSRVIPNAVRNPQLGIRREKVQNSRRFLVVALLGMAMAVFGFFTTLSKGGLERKFPGFRSVSTNADGRNQNVSRRDAKAQRRKGAKRFSCFL
jgi:hypothetical protein